ncbi:MAG: sulfite exporter TauE/SafE family protein [Thiomonas sp.]|jgi:uncharacterized membrane protein YfcA
MSADAALLLAGAATGLLVGLTGVGGGALMTPLLLLLGVAAPVAVATDLWFAVITKIAAIAAHRRHATIDWPVVRRLWAGSIPVALAVAWLVSHGAQPGKVGWLSQAIGVMVCIAALGILLGPMLLRRLQRPAAHDLPPRWQVPLTSGAGAVLGGAVALTSVGAGTLGSVLLLLLYPQRLNAHRLVLADLVHATGLAVIAGTAYAARGLVDAALLGQLLLGSVPAALLGGYLAGRTPSLVLQRALAVVLLLIGGKTAWGSG